MNLPANLKPFARASVARRRPIAAALALLLLALTLPSARASLLTLTLLNPDNTPNTNSVKVQQSDTNQLYIVGSTITTIGVPVRFTPDSNGVVNIYRTAGDWAIYGPTLGTGVVYRFLDASSNATIYPVLVPNTVLTISTGSGGTNYNFSGNFAVTGGTNVDLSPSVVNQITNSAQLGAGSAVTFGAATLGAWFLDGSNYNTGTGGYGSMWNGFTTLGTNILDPNGVSLRSGGSASAITNIVGILTNNTVGNSATSTLASNLVGIATASIVTNQYLGSQFANLNTVQFQMVALGTTNAPLPGNSILLANLPGAGQIEKINMDLSTNSATTGRLRIFTDGEAVPDVDCEINSLALCGQGVLGKPFYGSTRYLKFGADSSGNMTFTLFFQVPFTNGCQVYFYVPSTANGTGAELFYSQVAYRTNFVPPNYRLKSVSLNQAAQVTCPTNQTVYFFGLTNFAGWMVHQGVCITNPGGSSLPGTAYNDRKWIYAVDGEPLVTNSFNVVHTKYMTSGGESLPDFGWNFGGLAQITGDPRAMVVINSNGVENFCYEFLDQGGVRFTNAMIAGWSLKENTTILSIANVFYTYLFFEDPSIPWAPSQPGLTGVCNSNSTTISIVNPISQGSQPITSWWLNYTNGATNVFVTFPASVGTTNITGITSSNWNWRIAASNNIGLGWYSTNFSFANYIPPGNTNVTGAKVTWKFYGNGTDSSGNGYTATTPNALYANGVNGTVNSAIAGYYTFTNMMAGVGTTYPMTMGCWVKNYGGIYSQFLFGQYNSGTGDQDYIYLDGSGHFQCATHTSAAGYVAATSSATYADTNWHYLMGVWQSATSRAIYVDGVLQGTSSTSASPGAMTLLGSGAIGTSAPYYYEYLQVWSRALTAGEAASEYNYQVQ